MLSLHFDQLHELFRSKRSRSRKDERYEERSSLEYEMKNESKIVSFYTHQKYCTIIKQEQHVTPRNDINMRQEKEIAKVKAHDDCKITGIP